MSSVSLAFSPDGGRLAGGGTFSTVSVWDVSDLSSPRELTTMRGHRGSVTALSFLNDTTIVSGSEDGTARVWDVTDSGQIVVLAALSEHSGLVHAVDIDPSGVVLATGNSDGTVLLWDMKDPNSPTPLARLDGHAGPIVALAFDGEGRLATGSSEGRLLVWDTNPDRLLARVCAGTGQPVQDREWRHYVPTSAAQSPCAYE